MQENFTPDDLLKIVSVSDDSVVVTDFLSDETNLMLFIQKKEQICFCEECGTRMRSKGSRERVVNHPILQDGRNVTLYLKTWKWHCPVCGAYCYDQFNFVEPAKKNSDLGIYILLEKMRDLNKTAVQIANELNVSDTYVHETFMRYVEMERLPLGSVLSIDEVHLKFDRNDLYSIVLMDWQTGDIIDILPNRFKETILTYFSKIPKEERNGVRYLVSDMYDTYTDLAGTVFPNAVSVIDCFHHTQPLIEMILAYVRKVEKRYKERDEKRRQEKNFTTNRDHKTIKQSREVRLLKKYRWLITKNYDDIEYVSEYRHIQGRGGGWFSLENIEKEFMELDPNFRKIRDLKEKYIQFTHSYVNDREGAARRLDELIKEYSECDIHLFREFAQKLMDHREGIINSFIYLEATRENENDAVLRRISNGPMEGYNVKPKNLKRNSKGVRNFSYTRNRLLFATRKDKTFHYVNKTKAEIHTPGKKRGPYKKKKKEASEN